MRKTLALFALLVAPVGSCRSQGASANASHPAKAVSPSTPSAAAPALSVESALAEPSSLYEELEKTLGSRGPVAIVAGGDGIVAVSLDGALKRTLVPGRASWALVDDRSRVVWFQRAAGEKSELLLIDLTQPSPKPELMIAGLPEHENIAIGYASANAGRGARRADDIVVPAFSEYDGCFTLVLHPSGPSIGFRPGQYDRIFEEQGEKHQRNVREAQVVENTMARLREIAARTSDRRLNPKPARTPKPDRVSAVSPKRCEQADLCGTADSIPGTRFLRVLVEHGCGDACHVRWQLYDPQAKQFFDYKSQKRSDQPIDGRDTGNVVDAYVSRNGEGFIVDGEVYRFVGGKVFAGKGKGGGWLGGQWTVGL